MNDSANGHSTISAHEVTNPINRGSTTLLPQIHEALDIVHGPHSSNDSRREASIFLDNIKSNAEAPYHGFTLASDRSQQPVVRHYALSLLEHAIKHKWQEYSEAQGTVLREWILQLSQNVSPEDPLYLRNKIAQLWVEIAKRSWAAEWLDMDELLVRLWEVPGSVVHKEFVLLVLETLSEEIFNGEDTVAVLREGALSKACVEIFTPATVLTEVFPNRQPGIPVRHGEEGWLLRIGELLNQCLESDLGGTSQYQTCAVKTLAVYKSVMPWAIPKAVSSASCVQHMSNSLATPSVAVQLMISNLGSFIEAKISAIPEDSDLPSLLNLFLAIAQSQSFVVSIPLLVTWSRLLRSEIIGSSPTITPLIAPLLELCSSRLIRYESLPEDSNDPSLIFLLEDIDTVPERHAFLGNYRRYSVTIIEAIVRQKRSEAIYHILGQVDQSMRQLYDGQAPFSIESYSKASVPVLRTDAHFTVVEATLKGYMKWRSAHGSESLQDVKCSTRCTSETYAKITQEQECTAMEGNFEAWCERLLELNYEDPAIRKRILQAVVQFSTSALDKNTSFMLKVLEHILMSRPVERPEYPSYNDAVKEFQADGVYELQRIASKMPDQLLDVYEQLEAKVNEIISSGTLDPKRQTAYQTFLFTVILRASKIEPDVRFQKLIAFVNPVKQSWQDPELDQALTSFGGFSDLLGLGKVKDYLVARRVHEIEDWGLYQLDPKGQSIQKELEERLKALPLRSTKSLLACSTEKIDRDSATWKVTLVLWREALPVILPSLLKFLSHAHAFHNPANWSGLPAEMRPMVSRILTDRFWQAGISVGSKDDFYARVTGTKSTMEGLASSIRGSVRTIREACYSILWSMSRLGVDFYGFRELPGPLAHALFADAECLSSHQLIALLNVVRLLVDDCPVELRSHFAPPIMATCFSQMDAKCSSEWETLARKQAAATESDDLTEEMKEESILRQLTHSAVMMIGVVLDPARQNPEASTLTAKDASACVNSHPTPVYPSMRKFCLTSSTILEPLLMFLTHAIRMRDGRCCGVALRIFRSLVPDFTSRDEPLSSTIREFISTDVLKACISSLNEPYFVELQRDLATVIGLILIYYSPLSSTPRQILISIPGVHELAVDKCIDYITRQGVQQRQQRALVLDLLRDIKGVSISEQGRIPKSVPSVKVHRSKMQQEFMKAPSGPAVARPSSPSLEGVAGMFEEL
ncbi:ARM repeat-containing protein [Diplocarpon rosae]|nr:ARM repeat-containing protein [Diplocarpon rosae]